MIWLLALATSSSFKCTNRRQNFDPGDDYDDYLGKGNGAIVRATTTNFPYAVVSQDNWDYAASVFPHINFMEIDGFRHSKFTKTVEIPYEDRSTVPYHVPFYPDENKIIYDGFIRAPVAAGEESRFFIEYVNKVFDSFPLLPPVHNLDNATTDSFYNIKKYKVLVLYESKCTEASTYLGKWIDMFGRKYVEEIELGALDCSRFSNECERWSKNVPTAILFGKNGEFIEMEAHMSDTIPYLNETLAWAIDQVRISDPKPSPVPIPYVEKVTVVQTPLPVPKASKVLTFDRLEKRDANTIISKFKAVNTAPAYPFNPVTSQMCDQGIHNQEDIDKTINLLNFVRELSGMIFNATYDKSMTPNCQHDAMIMSINDVISHDLRDNKTLRCYQEGKTGVSAKLANLALHVHSCWYSIFGFLADSQENNIAAAHRRSLLDPRYTKVGLGFYGGDRSGAAVIQVYTSEGFYPFMYDDNVPFVAWPNPGPFPISLFPNRWSVAAEAFSKKNGLTIDDINISIQRDDGIILKIASMLIDHDGGTGDGLIFDIYSPDLSLCTVGHSFKVLIHIPKLDQLITYTTTLVETPELKPSDNIFENLSRIAFLSQKDPNYYSKQLELEKQICELHNMTNRVNPDDILPCEYGFQVYGGGLPFTEFFNWQHQYVYDIDVITEFVDVGSFDLRQSKIAHTFKFHLNPFKGQVHLGNYQTVVVDDPSLTDFIVDFKINKDMSINSGLIKSLGQAKSVSINLIGKPNHWKICQIN